MEWFFKGIIKFIVGMFSGGSDVSSKRVNGTLCILTVLLILIIFPSFGIVFTKELMILIKMVFWGGTALLGLGIADKIFTK